MISRIGMNVTGFAKMFLPLIYVFKIIHQILDFLKEKRKKEDRSILPVYTMVSLLFNRNKTSKSKVAIEKWSSGCNPKRCKFETFLVSSYLKANCARCGIRLSQGTKMASCSTCDTDICYPCKKEVQQEKRRNSTSALTKTSDKKTEDKVKGRRSSYSQKPAATTTATTTTPSTTKKSSKRTTRRHSAPSLTGSSSSSNIVSNNHHGHQMCVISCVLGKGGKKVEMMVDSGASNSAISYGLAKHLKLDRMMSQLNGRAFGVGSAQIVGHISNVPCIVGKMEFPIDFLVLDGPYQEDLLLLGLDQMRKHGCMIDLSEEIILFGGRKGIEVPMVSKKGGDDNSVFTNDCRNLIDDAVSVLTKDDLSV